MLWSDVSWRAPKGGRELHETLLACNIEMKGDDDMFSNMNIFQYNSFNLSLWMDRVSILFLHRCVRSLQYMQPWGKGIVILPLSFLKIYNRIYRISTEIHSITDLKELYSNDFFWIVCTDTPFGYFFVIPYNEGEKSSILVLILEDDEKRF